MSALGSDPISSADLPRATPESQGLSSAAVLGFLDAIEADEDIGLHSLMILRHGVVVAEGWWEPYRRDDVHLLYSLSKSFTSTAAGFARAEGLLSLDRPAWEYLPNLDRVDDERLRRLTVRDALRMATGHRTDTLERVAAAYRTDEPLRAFFDAPPEQEPGSVFCYNNGATYLVAAIVQQVAGMPLTDYLQPRLFGTLGIETPYWQSVPPGRNIGFSGLHLTTESIARFGQLYLDDGVWRGRQVLPPGWVAEATRAHTPNPEEPNPDWRQGYGYQFWRSRHNGYRGDGAFGQFCLVLPEQDAVIVTTADTEQMQRLLDLVWHRLLPGFVEAELADDHGLAARLSERLDLLRLAPTTKKGDDSAGSGGPNPWVDTDLSSEPASAAPALIAVEVGPDPGLTDDDHDGVLTIGMAGSSSEQGFRVPYRSGGWARSESVLGARRLRTAGTGAWSADGFRGEIVFVNTPHRLLIEGSRTADGSGGSGNNRWRCAPLGSGDPAALAVG